MPGLDGTDHVSMPWRREQQRGLEEGLADNCSQPAASKLI